ncbi:hypothetical protein Cfor_01730 [Coptotermes formosanus]|uniref:Mos1 transposase HTH domain-containing protein n=1 Tax=Coptotermes formosanus TaxID=36987 RepID=A0A6L2PZS6_COPFO|nr:hypothetical protein Cfor_01730 [Coptotermes formosanus]
MSAMYGPDFMSDTCVREWCRKFRDRTTDTHDDEGQRQPSLVTDDLAQHVDTLVSERRGFTISELSLEFPQVSRKVFPPEIDFRIALVHEYCPTDRRKDEQEKDGKIIIHEDRIAKSGLHPIAACMLILVE